jgi:hypothetical protein
LHSIVEADISGIGFIIPGLGLKGKLTSLLTDGDLDEMYWQYSNKRDILIWCYAETEQNKGDLIENTSRKRSRSPRPQQPHVKQARQDKCDEKIAAVEGIVSELQSINIMCQCLASHDSRGKTFISHLPYFKGKLFREKLVLLVVR